MPHIYSFIAKYEVSMFGLYPESLLLTTKFLNL